MISVLYESWRPHPLAWIHRAEARALAAELQAAGRNLRLVRFDAESLAHLSGDLLLRLSDPVMLSAARALTQAAIRYLGPSASVIERCYDKSEATRIAAANGVDCPRTAFADDAGAVDFPLVLKPRRGSDSIGVRVLQRGPIPAKARTQAHIVQPLVRGHEITVGVLHGRAGQPLRIFLPEGTPYSFVRKYLVRPRCAPLEDSDLAARVRQQALRIADLLGVDWAARIDFIHEARSGRLAFLECDVAPLVGARSAFAASLSAGGVKRQVQLELLLTPLREPAESASRARGG